MALHSQDMRHVKEKRARKQGSAQPRCENMRVGRQSRAQLGSD